MSEIQKKSLFFFLFPNASIFNVVKGTKNLSKREEKELVSFLECEDFIQ